MGSGEKNKDAGNKEKEKDGQLKVNQHATHLSMTSSHKGKEKRKETKETIKEELTALQDFVMLSHLPLYTLCPSPL